MNLTQRIRDDVFDLSMGDFGFAQLIEIYTDDEMLSEDTYSEICQDLGHPDEDRSHDLILAGFLLGISKSDDQ